MDIVGVGLIGAGPVTHAIHLPTLASLGDRLRVTHVMDVDASVAAAVAARAARSTRATSKCYWTTRRWTSWRSAARASSAPARSRPPCAAGKRAILCEKPLAIDPDGRARIVNASVESGVPIIVGAMHV